MKRTRGQSIVEYLLSAGLVSLVALAGLQVLSDGLGDMWLALAGRFGMAQLLSNPATGVTVSGPATPWDTQHLPFALTPQAELLATNQLLTDALSDLQGNNLADYEPIADLYFDNASANLGMVQQLEALANELMASDPDGANAILALARTGKLLSANQYSVVTDSAWDDTKVELGENLNGDDFWYHLQGKPEFFAQWQEGQDLQQAIAIETGQQVGNFLPNGDITYDHSKDLSKDTESAAENSQHYANQFTSQYLALEKTLGDIQLSPAQASILHAASQEIIYRSDIYSMSNASLTYYNSKKIESTAEEDEETTKTAHY